MLIQAEEGGLPRGPWSGKPLGQALSKTGLARAARTNPAVVVAALFLLLLVACAVAPGWFVSGNPLAINPNAVLAAPSAAHLFGTDQYGRDMLAQIVYGTRTSLLVGVTSVLLGATAGTAAGMIAGFRGGLADGAIMRIIDVMLCFPGILLALVFQAALGAGVGNEIIAVAVASVPIYARVARGQTRSLRGRPFVLAARSAGVRELTIIRRHLLTPVLAPVVALATIGVGTAVVLAAALSFLGLGPQNGHPDWGSLIGSGQEYMGTAWWIVTFPGIVITLVVLAAGVCGDALRRRLAGEMR
jgi:peptide/nickel transport system permease protein